MGRKTKKIPFVTDSPIYKPSQINEVLQLSVNDDNLRGTNKSVYYYNVPCSFDIETTSFYRNGNVQYSYVDVKEVQKNNPKAKFEKCALMYVWQLGINGVVIVGRTWSEFIETINSIVDILGLNEKKRLIIYVHNLAYEFQFMRNLFEWSKVFAIDERKPVYAITTGWVEFRCSYLLTGYSLAKVGENLMKYPVKKQVGDLDYNLPRHSETPLTDIEMRYCVNDVRVVMACIQEKIDIEGDITNIPLTKTGYVRKHCRKNCLYVFEKKTDGTNGKRHPNHEFVELMTELQISDMQEFRTLHRAFQGGFTHANSQHVGNIIDNVASYDFTSSYPYVMVAEQYPMSRGMKVEPQNQKEFEHYLNKYCCVFDIRIKGIISHLTQDTPLSVSKCYNRVNVVENNGRVFSADEITTTITNVDYKIYKTFYVWDSATVNNMYVYRRGYLPTEFVRTILELYKDKTVLKGVEGKEVEYLSSKEMVNACYGMAVTNPIRDEFTYITDWGCKEATEDEKAEMLYKYNTAQNRFLFYVWGVFVTAYARRNLFTAIYTMGDDYIYSDTDSVKVRNHDKYKDYFDKYNNEAINKLKRVCNYHNLQFELVEPSTIKGIKKMLGVWDFEGVYDQFKTLGAKRYMVKHKGALKVDGKEYDYSLTVSGLNKQKAIPYLIDKYGNDIMNVFNDNLYIPPMGTGKNIHTYIDYPIEGELCDYMGNVAKFFEHTGIHLEPTDYTLSLSIMFLDYILGKHLKQ